jgi:hypothetical protein
MAVDGSLEQYRKQNKVSLASGSFIYTGKTWLIDGTRGHYIGQPFRQVIREIKLSLDCRSNPCRARAHLAFRYPRNGSRHAPGSHFIGRHGYGTRRPCFTNAK